MYRPGRTKTDVPCSIYGVPTLLLPDGLDAATIMHRLGLLGQTANSVDTVRVPSPEIYAQ
jgi:hypothetical protein